jgi:hypothetical protein
LFNSIVGAAFWMFLAIAVVAGIWSAIAQNRETQKTIRLAIEKGVQLDAALVDKLVTGKTGKPEGYYIGGIISTAVGLGLPILGYFIGRIAPDYFFPIVGSGILVGLIGISLIGCGMLLSRRKKACKNGNHPV